MSEYTSKSQFEAPSEASACFMATLAELSNCMDDDKKNLFRDVLVALAERLTPAGGTP